METSGVRCPIAIANPTLKVIPLSSRGLLTMNLPETNEIIVAMTVVAANFSPFRKIYTPLRAIVPKLLQLPSLQYSMGRLSVQSPELHGTAGTP